MKNNLLANVLLVVIGLLLLLSALQLVGWGRGIETLEAQNFDVSSLDQLQVEADGADTSPAQKNAVDTIVDAPLFSISRTPYIPPAEPDEGDIESELIVAEPLKARVTSIIITDENKYVMMVDEVSKERVTLQQGMPLPGEQGLWVVDSIQPRAVVFKADGEEPVELELEVFDGQLSKGGRQSAARSGNSSRDKKPQAITAADEKEKQKNSAEEIRKKIAERRAQMRANAAKGKKQ